MDIDTQIGDDGVRQYMNRMVGNAKLREKLCLDVLAGKLNHAVILEGAKGTGKHTVAMNVAAALACTEKNRPDTDVPCGSCRGCKKVLEGKSPDVIIIGCGTKATLGVDAIRVLREDVHTVPNDLDFKLYIIEDADKMTTQAQNALLLTLEEPPSFVRFVLLCESADMLLETIRSRAPVLRTEPIPNEELRRYICDNDRRAAQMQLTAPEELSEIVMAADRGIGRALELLDTKTFAPVRDMRQLAVDFVSEATDTPNVRRIFPLLTRFSQKRDILAKQLGCLSSAVNDLILLKKADTAPLSFFADRDRATEICDRCSVSFLYGLGNAVMTAIDSNSRNANVRLTLLKMVSDAGII
jgi:DNA polymerase-3 subunit delta'